MVAYRNYVYRVDKSMKFGNELLKSVLNEIRVGAQVKIQDGSQNGRQTAKKE